jgi:nitrogen fixation protein FixH
VTGARWWPAALAGVLAVTVLGNIAVYWIANDDPSFAVEPNYYQRAVDWDSTMAQRARSAALGWVADARLAPPANGQAALLVHLRTRDGAALDSADVRAEASFNARGADLFEVRLTPLGAGLYSGTLPSARAGLWRVDLSAVHGADRFLERITLDNGEPPSP